MKTLFEMKRLVIIIGLFISYESLPLHAQIPLNGMVAFFPFNNNTLDASGNGNNGVNYGAVITNDRCNHADSAYQFDGISNYIKMKDSPSLNFINAISLCAWISPVSFYGTGNNAIISKGYYDHIPPYYQYHLGITGDSYPNDPASFAFSLSLNGEYFRIVANSNWQPNHWYFVSGTYDGNTMKIYVNAVLMTKLAVTGLIDIYNQDLFIAHTEHYPGGSYTPGKIDDILIYNRALTEKEIQDLYSINCSLEAIQGTATVCQGQKNVPYAVNNSLLTDTYQWTYSGTGVTIKGGGDSVLLDFSDQATSGILAVSANNGSYGSQTVQLPITVQTIPGKPEIIAGPSEVCLNQNGAAYSATVTGNPTSYIWQYSGTGATILGNASNIYINFSNNATSGELSLTAMNNCGTSEPSNKLNISVKDCKLDAIQGSLIVCQGQNNIPYTINNSLLTYLYQWNYSGTGVIIKGGRDSVLLDFSDQATSGILSVSVNSGTYGNQTVQLPITVQTIVGKPEIIAGPSEVCLKQNNVEYSATATGNPTSYIWQYSGTGATILGNTNTIYINFSDTATSGALSVSSMNNCGTSDPSNKLNILVKDCSSISPELNIPNAFTPNGDNINDVFYIRGLRENTKVQLFDRNGKLVYQSDNYRNDWDGKDKDGKTLESGTYWYIITVPGLPTEFKGYVFLKK